MIDTEPALILGAVGVSLGVISLTFCIIQAIIMAKLYRRLSQSIQLHTRPATDCFLQRREKDEDDHEDVQDVAAVFTEDYDDVVCPGMSMLPVPQHQQIAYQASQTNSLKSYTSDSTTQDHELKSPTVAELKNSLALPLKRVFDKSCTLDNRNMFNYPERQSHTRPRAQTNTALIGADRTSAIARTPNGKSELESTLNTPGSNGSPCNNPMAYIVTEIVDVKDTKKRPSVRLRESRPKGNLSKTIQKQLEEPEPFYFGLEKAGAFKEDKEASTPVPVQNINKGWRQVLPLVTDGNKMFATCDENENTCHVSPDKDGPSSRNTSEKDFKYKHKVALQPPVTKKVRPVLEKSSSVGPTLDDFVPPSGMQRGGTWSPKTLERHRMLLEGTVGMSHQHQRDQSRIRAGSLRDRAPSPYELVETPSARSVRSVACAEEMGCYSKIVRQHDGRRRASSTGSSDISRRSSDRSYNKLMIGV